MIGLFDKRSTILSNIMVSCTIARADSRCTSPIMIVIYLDNRIAFHTPSASIVAVVLITLKSSWAVRVIWVILLSLELDHVVLWQCNLFIDFITLSMTDLLTIRRGSCLFLR